MDEPVSISFWGSPYISSLLLEELIKDKKFNIKFVVTQEDKPRVHRGRSSAESDPTPVKVVALRNNIPVYTPASLKKCDDLLSEWKQYQVMFHTVFAYGKIIPEKIISSAKMGTLNFHASLLPLLRGASPIEYTLLNGFSRTGWTLQKMVYQLDAGGILKQTSLSVSDEDTTSSLTQKLMDQLLQIAPLTLLEYSQNQLKETPQKESDATHCTKLDSSMGQIEWNEPMLKLRNQFRALQERPGVFTHFQNKKMKLTIDTQIPLSEYKKFTPNQPGAIGSTENNLLWVECGDQKFIPVNQIQPEGKKKLSAIDFSNGYRISSGAKFENIFSS